jgi:alpha-galactosidase
VGAVTPAPLSIEVGNVPAFKTDVAAGETFLVPPAFVGCYTGDIDDGSYTLHRFVLDKLVPKFPAGYPHPTLAYNLYLDAGGPHAKEADVIKSAALAHELGFETFVVDAMWFPQSGDWRWDPERFPHGAQPIEEFVHSHDMAPIPMIPGRRVS